MATKTKRTYGFRRAPYPNFRLTPTALIDLERLKTAPLKFDQLSFQPKPFDQGQEGSCTANSANGEVTAQCNRLLLPLKGVDFSRHLTYVLERMEQGSPLSEDSGSSISESAAVLEKYGVVAEKDWPYTRPYFAKVPTKDILAKAKLNKIVSTVKVEQSYLAIKSQLLQGLGVLIGFTVYESFESNAVTRSGIMPIPTKSEDVLGGHAVRAIGYDDTKVAPNGYKGAVRFRNSWGKSWGQDGDFWMWAYCIDKQRIATDFHSITRVK